MKDKRLEAEIIRNLRAIGCKVSEDIFITPEERLLNVIKEFWVKEGRSPSSKNLRKSLSAGADRIARMLKRLVMEGKLIYHPLVGYVPRCISQRGMIRGKE